MKPNRPLAIAILLTLIVSGLSARTQPGTASPTTAKPGSNTIFENMEPELRAAHENTAIRLWSGRAPQATGDAAGDTPLLYPMLPSKGGAPVGVVLVLPGGGYTSHVPKEAFPIAEHFRAAGLAAFVLQYRLRPYNPAVALLNAQRAVRLLRDRAAEFGIDPTKVAAIEILECKILTQAIQ